MGTGTHDNITKPQQLFKGKHILQVVCASESTKVLDTSGNIWGCGWNEHGNLSIGSNEDAVLELTKTVGATIVAPPSPLSSETNKSNNKTRLNEDESAAGANIVMASGGAHFIAALKH